MTQDQYGQTRGPGYVRDDAVPDDENEEYSDGQAKPMTRFQKVASALRGGAPELDEQDQTAADQVAAADQSGRAQMSMADSPVSRDANPQGDYWDEPVASAADRDEAVDVTNPDVPRTETGTNPLARQDQLPRQVSTDTAEQPAIQPDMFGTTTHAGNGTTSSTQTDATQADAAIPDVPADGAQANGIPASGVAAGGVPASGVPASGVPADEATGTTGRHAATAPGGTESRPGGAAGALGDFSDLTFGNLIPDAAHYTEQWQQIQFRFVDDPHGSVTEAAEIVAQVTTKMEAAIQERQRAIEERQRAIAEQQRSLRGRWGDDANADTEALRETLRMYKTFLDQLIGPRAG